MSHWQNACCDVAVKTQGPPLRLELLLGCGGGVEELEGLELDEGGGGGGVAELLLDVGRFVFDELDVGGCSALQLDTICATPALTNSIQVESDICEQVPAFNLQ